MTTQCTYRRHKNIRQKTLPARSMIAKRNFILNGSYFCEKYTLWMCADSEIKNKLW